jgi:hypothetical protein
MPPLARASNSFLANVKMTITGYLCSECGHWNNLKRRKFMRPVSSENSKEAKVA